MRRLLALTMLLAPIAVAAQAPAAAAGQAQVPQIPGVSPAGMAALEKLRTRQDPAVPKQLKDEADIRQKTAAMLAAPTVDLDKLAAAMAQARAVQANGRRVADDHLLVMLRALPPGDRPAFLRAITGPRPASPAR